MRYSARDLAVYRAHAAGVPVDPRLGDAVTRELDAARSRDATDCSSSRSARAPAAASPRCASSTPASIRRSTACRRRSPRRSRARLARREQSLVFLNRRGYAPVLVCGACGWIGGCTRCAAHLVLHTADRRLRCHHCGLETAIPRHCPICGNVDLAPFGRGTQRIEETLAARFPGARVLRIDSDSTRAKGRWETMRGAIAAGDADILVGTQILAKGHDFPRVTLVGILNADAALVAADYRAPERLFAQLYQVAGRAGRRRGAGRSAGPDALSAAIRFTRRWCATSSRRSPRRWPPSGAPAGFPPFVHEAVAARGERCVPRRDRVPRARARGRAGRSRRGPRPVRPGADEPRPARRPRARAGARAVALASRAAGISRRVGPKRFTRMRAGEVRWHLDVDPIEF